METFTKEGIIRYLKAADTSRLFTLADRLRVRYFGNEVHIRGIIELSNYCKRDCLYCGLRKGNKNITRYRMGADEIIDTAISMARLGYKTILLQSGEDDSYSISALCDIIKAIKSAADCAVTLSLGEKGFDEYKRLRQAGADRYLLRFETSDKRLFRRLKPDSSYENRLACLQVLKDLGFQTGSGMMIGLPGQTHEILADDILLLRELCPDMIGIGPFLPHHNTPLVNTSPGTIDLTLRVLAIIRILIPDAHIPATTAMGTVVKNGRERALRCGANVIMPNVTPIAYRKYYEIYPNKIYTDETISDCRLCLETMLKASGRTIAIHRGESIRKKT
jgi:biotin synthase